MVTALFSDGVTYVLPPGAIPGLTSRRAQPGDNITFYGVGFGPVIPNTPAGQSVQQTNALASSFVLNFGQTQASVTYAGLAPDAQAFQTTRHATSSFATEIQNCSLGLTGAIQEWSPISHGSLASVKRAWATVLIYPLRIEWPRCRSRLGYPRGLGCVSNRLNSRHPADEPNDEANHNNGSEQS